ncbi:serine aminopeptidase domain-containing protein [Bacteroidota bacterium]
MKRILYSWNKLIIVILVLLFISLFLNSALSAQESIINKSGKGLLGRVLTNKEIEKFFEKPDCLAGYRPLTRGPLLKLDSVNGNSIGDTTYIVETKTIISEGLKINGWLYLPEKEGKYPLVVLTNGGGDDSAPIKSLSDFIAPVFAHCGIAAFVHDKRGTGESEGIFTETSFEDYINDAGNCAIFLSKDPRIDTEKIGVMGGSEGGRTAVIAASRFPVFSFVVSLVGPMLDMIEDRLYAQMNALRGRGVSDSVIEEIKPLWKQSFLAWGSQDTDEHKKVNKQIDKYRENYERGIIPYKKNEMDTIPAFIPISSTWNSLGYDYMTELKQFKKKWLAIYGEDDTVVNTKLSVENILQSMSLSGNIDFSIAVIPKCGHAPVNSETGRRILFDNLILNWLQLYVL